MIPAISTTSTMGPDDAAANAASGTENSAIRTATAHKRRTAGDYRRLCETASGQAQYDCRDEYSRLDPEARDHRGDQTRVLMIPTLTSARVAIVSGKGGVGKTTVASAVAI